METEYEVPGDQEAMIKILSITEDHKKKKEKKKIIRTNRDANATLPTH